LILFVRAIERYQWIRKVTVSVAEKILATAILDSLIPLPLKEHKIKNKHGNEICLLGEKRLTTMLVFVASGIDGQNGTNVL